MSIDRGGEEYDLAPVIPLFGGDVAAQPQWRSTWDEEPESAVASAEATAEGDPAAVEGVVLRKLRTRQLSEAETLAVIRGHDLDEESVDALMRGLRRHGYLDDAALAEQLVHAAVDRKGQGRHAVAQTLAKRRIPRDVADAALATLPDDDEERAFEYAVSRSRSMARLDYDTGLRRLVGQLSRRGYPSSVAMTAARRALEHHGIAR